MVIKLSVKKSTLLPGLVLQVVSKAGLTLLIYVNVYVSPDVRIVPCMLTFWHRSFTFKF